MSLKIAAVVCCVVACVAGFIGFTAGLMLTTAYYEGLLR